jgi:surface polysaccharide O-acyltransferase-like enzyme
MSRSRHLDILNIAACASVVVLHATGEVFSFSLSGTWWAAMLLQSLGHFAVPVFFMLSGATLLDYRQRYTTREYFHKRWQRIGIPFIFWTCFYIVWNQLALKAPVLTGPLAVFDIFLNNGASNIFWFFYALVPIYLLIPVLSLIDWQKNRRVLFYLLALFFLFNQILPLLSRFAGIGITSYMDLPFKASYLDYALLGYFLQHLRLTPLRRSLLLAGGGVGFAGMAGGTWLLSRPAGVTDTFLMDYHSLFCYMSAIAVFVLVRSLCEGREVKENGAGRQRGNVLT